MQAAKTFLKTWKGWFDPTGREQRIKDYIHLANQLVWKRQASFLAAAVLAALYFDPVVVFMGYALVVVTELLDGLLAHKSKNWDGQDKAVGRQILKGIFVNTALSALAISFFIAQIANQQVSGGHFTPLFFLFSASVFAAMYNSQMLGILLLRISIYGVAFLYIALLDVIRYNPPLSSNIWLEFFTLIFVLYFIFDISITFYRRYQERIEQMKLIEEENRRTKAALEVKSQFLSTVSHELRTPLTSIIGSLELVRNNALGDMPDNMKPIIGIAAKNSQRLAALIEDLLDVQKIEAGEMRFHFETLCANALVHEAVDSSAGFASRLGIPVKVIDRAGGARINGDRNRLIQVLNNLLSNALKFSDKGGVVTVCSEVVGQRVRISVRDEGLGIPENSEECVFGKFSQIDSSDIRKVGGTGLGLNISRQIMNYHDADLSYESELGVGTTFYMEFDSVAEQSDKAA